MPTGSLCAERNVIGTALSEDLTLKRQDLKMVAVLSVTLEDIGPASSTPRVGALPPPPPALEPQSRLEAPRGARTDVESNVTSGQISLAPSTPDYIGRTDMDSMEAEDPEAPPGMASPSTPPPRRLRMYGSMSPDPSPSGNKARRNLLDQELLDVVPPLPPSLSQVIASDASSSSASRANSSRFRFQGNGLFGSYPSLRLNI
jgi:hypothetical protein